jgi:glycosyltransferase involved in cell wall biosynthesis
MVELIAGSGIVKYNDYRVIHCHDPLSTCAALRSGVRRAVVVQTVHGPWSKESRGSRADSGTQFDRAIRRFEEEAFAGAHLLLPVDRGQAAILKNEFGVPATRIRVIENAVNVDGFSEGIGRPFSGNLPARYFLVPRRLVPKNGVEFAIRGFAMTGRRDVGLVIAGDGYLRRDLEALSRELGVSASVIFFGDVPREELLTIMKKSQAVVVPSVPARGVIEATSFSVLEAMAMGVPVIGSAIGGIAEIIRDGSMGYLTPPGDSKAIGTAMESTLAADDAVRAAIIRTARDRVRDRFGSKGWIEKVMASYREAIDGFGASSPMSSEGQLP